MVEDRYSWLLDVVGGIRMEVFIDRARCTRLLGNVVAVWKEDTNSPVRQGTIAIVMTTSMVTADVETPPIRTRMYRIMTSQRGAQY